MRTIQLGGTSTRQTKKKQKSGEANIPGNTVHSIQGGQIPSPFQTKLDIFRSYMTARQGVETGTSVKGQCFLRPSSIILILSDFVNLSYVFALAIHAYYQQNRHRLLSISKGKEKESRARSRDCRSIMGGALVNDNNDLLTKYSTIYRSMLAIYFASFNQGTSRINRCSFQGNGFPLLGQICIYSVTGPRVRAPPTS